MFHMSVFPVLYRKNYRWSEESRSTCSFYVKMCVSGLFLSQRQHSRSHKCQKHYGKRGISQRFGGVK